MRLTVHDDAAVDGIIMNTQKDTTACFSKVRRIDRKERQVF